MKFFSNVLMAFCLAAVAVGGDLKVPGDSPVEFCHADRDIDLIQIEKLDISPNPPKPGQALNVTISGEVRETITEGAYILVTVKVGRIKLISTTADFCEETAAVGVSCPIIKGKLDLTKTVNLPSAIPPATYTVLAYAYTVDDEEIFCLTATVSFSQPT